MAPTMNSTFFRITLSCDLQGFSLLQPWGAGLDGQSPRSNKQPRPPAGTVEGPSPVDLRFRGRHRFLTDVRR
jgi:hypothetical protein